MIRENKGQVNFKAIFDDFSILIILLKNLDEFNCINNL